MGTYPVDGPGGEPGRGEGIWRLDLDPASGRLTGALAAVTPAPSFLATSPDGRTLYAAGETTAGTVAAFAVGAHGGLTPRGHVASGGVAPCHLTLDAAGRTLYVANYGGSVAVLPLDADGGFAPGIHVAGKPAQVFTDPRPPDAGPTGPVADRQDGPHTHSCLLSPDGAYLLVADLGTDQLRRFRVGDGGRLAEAGIAATLPAGTGPRHLAWGSGGYLYVVGELSATVHVLTWDPTTGTAAQVQSLPAWSGSAGSAQDAMPAHLVRSGDRLLVSVRGPDVVAQFAVHDGGARLEHLGDASVGGAWPRHFALTTGWALVAAQGSGQVTALGWDGAELGRPAGSGFAVAHPACVVPT